ncbi:SPOR domain-containing protein [Mangrovitalea sediminis]|uniref:SPOR domain-containing protein n=1 Tax=Mangrovitalea sediminis TaxID=1982043 RepID=UPI000BE54D9C|nr:SPOR domain-containing protein [Mangrovitalea sediminis]
MTFRWRWLLPIGLVSGFAGLLVYLHSIPPVNPPVRKAPAVTHQPATTSTPSKTDSAGAGKPAQHFHFYDMLPESKVVTPKVKAYNPGPAIDDKNYQYYIQTGSFHHAADAEQQRARIAFQGLRADVKKITLPNNDIWYRVQIGPFASRSKMNSAVDKLVAINIAPLIRKIPAGK